MQRKNKIRKTIPVFFSADNNDMPSLSVALYSLLENASDAYRYAVHVLHAGLNGENIRRIAALATPHCTVSFTDVSEKIAMLGDRLSLRDFPFDASFYAVFLPELFPQYGKGVYLDCDTVITGDISELFAVETGDNYVGAVADERATVVPELAAYVQSTLHLPVRDYFHTGVLLLNLGQLREEMFYTQFYKKLAAREIPSMRAQDHWNVLCRGRVVSLPAEWNKVHADCEEEGDEPPKLLHYDPSCTDREDNAPYRGYFWRCAVKSPFFGEILNERLIAAR